MDRIGWDLSLTDSDPFRRSVCSTPLRSPLDTPFGCPTRRVAMPCSGVPVMLSLTCVVQDCMLCYKLLLLLEIVSRMMTFSCTMFARSACILCLQSSTSSLGLGSTSAKGSSSDVAGLEDDDMFDTVSMRSLCSLHMGSLITQCSCDACLSDRVHCPPHMGSTLAFVQCLSQASPGRLSPVSNGISGVLAVHHC